MKMESKLSLLTGADGVGPTQFAALCTRVRGGRLEVLLITSRDTGRWVLPKGWPISGLGPAATAAREAWEEGGVIGTPDEICIGYYSYTKMLGPAGALPCRVAVYPLQVDSMADDFPEKGQRRRKWFSPRKAAARVSEPDLAALLSALPAKP